MIEIQEDIRKSARNVMDDLDMNRRQFVGFASIEKHYLENAIATAILAERERCAKERSIWQ